MTSEQGGMLLLQASQWSPLTPGETSLKQIYGNNLVRFSI